MVTDAVTAAASQVWMRRRFSAAAHEEPHHGGQDNNPSRHVTLNHRKTKERTDKMGSHEMGKKGEVKASSIYRWANGLVDCTVNSLLHCPSCAKTTLPSPKVLSSKNVHNKMVSMRLKC